VHALIASIPSPDSSSIEIGPLRLTAYGLMIALGVVAAVEMGRVRWRKRGGNPDDIGTLAIWAVPAGLIGARLYHVITDWDRLYADHPGNAIKVWDGGLGIPGGILLGTLVGVLVARHLHINLPVGLDMVAPCLPLAQAIGRLGNWWNQELYGRPTKLPWGLEIDLAHRQAGYESYATFHPTFLYEMLWNAGLCVFLLWIDKKRVLRPGRLFVVYVLGYGLGRLWVEALRIDTATRIAGLRVNEWMSFTIILGASLFLILGGVRRRSDDTDEPYTDGHRYDADAKQIVAAAATDAGEPESDAVDGDEVDESDDEEVDEPAGEPEDSEEDATGPVSPR
jgi:prolipoprotein diacylglyceryl transferase